MSKMTSTCDVIVAVLGCHGGVQHLLVVWVAFYVGSVIFMFCCVRHGLTHPRGGQVRVRHTICHGLARDLSRDGYVTGGVSDAR